MKDYLKKILTEELEFDATFIASYYKDGKYVKSIPIFMKSSVKEAYAYSCKMFSIDSKSLKENSKHSPYVYIYEKDGERLILNAIDGSWKKE